MTSHKTFTAADQVKIFALVEKVAGTSKVAEDKPHIFLNNISRRMYMTGHKSLDDYISYAKKTPREYNELISALTIHTTYWFREKRHMEYLSEQLSQGLFKDQHIRILSMGCSTGEEVYSLALVMEAHRQNNPKFDYKIEGFDIDPVSIKKAQRAVYNIKTLEKIPKIYHPMILLGSNETKGLLTISRTIRQRCSFDVSSALEFGKSSHQPYDVIFCRNMLIYFDNTQVGHVVRQLVSKCKQDGLFFVGHSEDISQYSKSLNRIAGSTYKKISASQGNFQSPQVIDKPKNPLKSDIDALIVSKSQDLTQKCDPHLTKAHLKYEAVDTLNAAATCLKSQHLDVIILDLSSLSADTCLYWLTDQRQAGLTVPCLLLMDNSDQRVIEKASGFGNYLQEVFITSDLEQLNSKFSSYLIAISRAKNLFRYKPKVPLVFIDDDTDILMMYEELVSSEGYQVKTFSDPHTALEYIQNNPVYAAVLDQRMPVMKGQELAERIYQLKRSIPVIMVTGYVDEVETLKQSGIIYQALEKPVEIDSLLSMVQDACYARYAGDLSSLDQRQLLSTELMLIGGSTGAPTVIQNMLAACQGTAPPVVVVQHIQASFQEGFAQTVAQDSGLSLVLVEQPTPLEINHLYFSAPNTHIEIQRRQGQLWACPLQGPPVKGHRPCIDHMFNSAAQAIRKENTLAFLLTGMGDDGAEGLLALRNKGCYTVAQDIKSSVVFGMPKVAIDLNAASVICPPKAMHDMISSVSKHQAKQKKSA